jgi:hypothetical protein
VTKLKSSESTQPSRLTSPSRYASGATERIQLDWLVTRVKTEYEAQLVGPQLRVPTRA